MRGRVADDRGAALPGVTLTLRPSSGPPIVQVTNAKGLFSFKGVPAGPCDLEAELEGFNSVNYPNIRVGAGQVASFEIRLNPTVEETITVTAEAPRSTSAGWARPRPSTQRGSGGGYRRKPLPSPPLRPRTTNSMPSRSSRRGWSAASSRCRSPSRRSGKLLLLTGVLPPEKIGVQIEVKGNKEKRGWF